MEQIEQQCASIAQNRIEPYRGSEPRMMALNFEIISGENIYEGINPVLDALPVKEVDYGALFTYCFRRFGYPNAGSDGYKDIARWLLTTPREDLILSIRPSLQEEPHFSIVFLTTEEHERACRQWERADLDAWQARQLDWAEAQGLPEWMQALVEQYATEYEYPQATWRDVFRGYIVMFTPYPGKGEYSYGEKSKEEMLMTEYASKVDSYKDVEPRPPFRKRNADIGAWPDDDPMKPLALAATETLKDLQTGVRVRDQAITAFGLLEDGEENIVDEPEVAGYGMGALVNNAPEECAELLHLADKIGKGDVKSGLQEIIRVMQ